MTPIDETHDPDLTSWVPSAFAEHEFPIQNLPLSCFLYQGRQRIGAAIGDHILDLSPWLEGNDLVAFFSLGASDRKQLRRQLSRALRRGSPSRPIYLQTECIFLLPCTIGDYTDFYASIHHARNVGALFRPDNPLLPNYRYVPIAYHGRASSIVVSGTEIRRPNGQLGKGAFGPSAELDYEVELAAFIGPGNPLGEPIPIAEAEEHMAGLCLLNDWSARDIQRWEYQPLGPFLAKNFATSISPWVITAEALAPFHSSSPKDDRVEPQYLRSPDGALDIEIEAFLKSANSSDLTRLSRANFRDMYWTFPQMIAHHTVNGCPLRPGDLIGSGTISGPEKENRGCLLEIGDRRFLQDGDEVILRAHCQREGFRSIGFGNCTGKTGAAHHT